MYVRCWNCSNDIEVVEKDMSKSYCVSLKHQEWDCLIKWGVSSFKFTAEKWCHPCTEKHEKYITNGKVKTNANTTSKSGRGRKTAQGSELSE